MLWRPKFFKRVQARVREIRELEELVELLLPANKDLHTLLGKSNKTVVRLDDLLRKTRDEVHVANARASRNGAGFLLAMGLFVVQAYGFALYFLPK
jgi:hypothetical protein